MSISKTLYQLGYKALPAKGGANICDKEGKEITFISDKDRLERKPVEVLRLMYERLGITP